MSTRSCIKLEKSIISNGFFDTFDFVLADCDGVLWNANDAIPGSAAVIKALKDMGKEIMYITNNSTKSRENCLSKCRNLGFPAAMNDIISSPHCVATYLKSLGFRKKVYVIGNTSIAEELKKANIDCLPIGPDPVPEKVTNWNEQKSLLLNSMQIDPQVGAVVVGCDFYLSYAKLTKAATYLKNPDTLLIATNRDERFSVGDTYILPGAGPCVSAVEVASGRVATVLGKPEQYMLDCIKTSHPTLNPDRCLMIGDQLRTDILFGTKHGLKTLFVLTGANSLEDVRQLEKSSDTNQQLLIPDYYLPCLGDLL